MTERKSAEEFSRAVLSAHRTLRDLLKEGQEQGYELDEMHFSFYYTPRRDILSRVIQDIESHVAKPKPTQAESKQAGYKLEELALVVFHGLKGWSSLKSYQSAGPQYDLLISGSGVEWTTALTMLSLELKEGSSTILVEAKATKSKVSDQQVARLCSLIETNLSTSSALGIFFTLNGASGFPKSGVQKQRTAGASRLRQLLFYAKTGKPIVVMDIDDIRSLTENGSLLRILERKIRDIEELTGLPIATQEVREIVLPENLAELKTELSESE